MSEEQAPEVSATPAAQAHADELGVDLTQVEGSGAGGKITKADVAAAAEAPEASPAPAASSADREALQAERRAVADALNMANTAGIGDAAALQAVYDDLGKKLEELA